MLFLYLVEAKLFSSELKRFKKNQVFLNGIFYSFNGQIDITTTPDIAIAVVIAKQCEYKIEQIYGNFRDILIDENITEMMACRSDSNKTSGVNSNDHERYNRDMVSNLNMSVKTWR